MKKYEDSCVADGGLMEEEEKSWLFAALSGGMIDGLVKGATGGMKVRCS